MCFTFTIPATIGIRWLRGTLSAMRIRIATDFSRSQTLLRVTDERVFHNGGHLAFGSDNYLYVSLGDDGVEYWPQRLNRYHGKILRIDVQAVQQHTDHTPA